MAKKAKNKTQLQHAKFKDLLKRRPVPGDMLRSKHLERIEPVIQYESGGSFRKVRAMFVYVSIDPECTGWYLSNDPRGIKCMIVRADYTDVQQNLGGRIRQIRVLRNTIKGTGLVGEVMW